MFRFFDRSLIVLESLWFLTIESCRRRWGGANCTLLDVLNLPVAVLGSKIAHSLPDNRPIFRFFDRRLIVRGPFWFLTVESCRRRWGGADGTLLDVLNPVSYTHLDVYKRQLVVRGSFWFLTIDSCRRRWDGANGTLFDVLNLPVAVLGSKITHFLQDNRPIFGVIDRRLIVCGSILIFDHRIL